MNLEFNVYDNVESYKKAKPFMGNENTRLDIIDIWVKPPHNTFWFETNMIKEERYTNIHGEYVHFHPHGLQSPSNLQWQWDDPPLLIHKHWVKYDGERKMITINPSIMPWKKPIWSKHVTQYHGAIIPKKKYKLQGLWMYDYALEHIDIIMNYIPSVNTVL